MRQIEYATAESGATLIRVNETERICLTRHVAKETGIDLTQCWQDAITGTTLISTAQRARFLSVLVPGDRTGQHSRNNHTRYVAHCIDQNARTQAETLFCLNVQRVEHGEIRTTSAPHAYSEVNDRTPSEDAPESYDTPDWQDWTFNHDTGRDQYTPRTADRGTPGFTRNRRTVQLTRRTIQVACRVVTDDPSADRILHTPALSRFALQVLAERAQ